MIPRKKKPCKTCSIPSYIFSHGNCKNCAQKGYKSLKTGIKKPTGELALFLEIYQERGKRCEITGDPLVFNVSCFAHILGKGAYPEFRLLKENICMVVKRIHNLYDNGGKERLLKAYPGAIEIYHRKQSLKLLYHERHNPRSPGED